jgi:hypothetical protein
MLIKRKSITMKLKSLLSAFLIVVLLYFSVVSHAQTTVPVSTTDMHSDTINITPGMTSADIPFTVQTDESYIFNAMALVNGVAMSVVASSGTVFVPSSDGRIHFTDSATLGATARGGIFATDEITPNTIGVWKLHFTFPAATEKTVILASWVVNSAYHIGLLTDQSQYVTGNTATIWVFGTEGAQGQTVPNSNPKVTLRLLPSGKIVIIPVKGDDSGPRKQAKAGLFTGSYQFKSPGAYLITGAVTLPTINGPMVRTAEQQVTVRDAPIMLNRTSIQSTGTDCSQLLDIKLDLSVNQAGTYVFRGQLAGADGTTLTQGQSFDLATGTQSIILSFLMDTIHEKFGYASPLAVNWVMGFYVDSDSFAPVVTQYNVGTYAGVPCRDPISVGSTFTLAQTTQDGQIKAFNFSFPVNVITTGSYDITFNIVDFNGKSVDQLHLTETLTAGDNTVAFSEPGEKFANTNGPYRISGLAVVGAGNSAVVFQLVPVAADSGLAGAKATAATPVPVNAP